ncbi:unnamed protein product [Chondrus crispus]|uniref:Uncharacterized protein n=1 Tax=Chondrus crispus TaxID=2769 RepID=R7QK65_CHOCR|nr:unnamed protein product [Chondrus crispus]CDF38459.1 unnamed protein product [Chondrus crispus]|eukprot:XP_005718352.1 unnamed protein product [Chondrus crispus]
MARFSSSSSLAEYSAFFARLRMALSRFLRILRRFLSSAEISGLEVRRPPRLFLVGGSVPTAVAFTSSCCGCCCCWLATEVMVCERGAGGRPEGEMIRWGRRCKGGGGGGD